MATDATGQANRICNTSNKDDAHWGIDGDVFTKSTCLQGDMRKRSSLRFPRHTLHPNKMTTKTLPKTNSSNNYIRLYDNKHLDMLACMLT